MTTDVRSWPDDYLALIKEKRIDVEKPVKPKALPSCVNWRCGSPYCYFGVWRAARASATTPVMQRIVQLVTRFRPDRTTTVHAVA